jgi:hypothetical protein
MRPFPSLFALAATLTACGSLHSGSAPPDADRAIAVPAEVLPPHGMLLLGDLHGTREIPRAVGQIVAAVAARDRVVLALEMPAARVPSLPEFLAGPGGPAARAALLADPWWHEPFQDGRRSAAMADLVETVRQLRANGRRVDVVAIDTDDLSSTPEAREAALATHVTSAWRGNSDASMIIYTGNLHTGSREVSFRPGFRWMAMRIADAGIPFVTLNARWADGTAWTCPDDTPEHCGVGFFPGYGAERGIKLETSEHGDFDGWFGAGAITASPPAAFPERAAGLDAKIGAAMSSPRALRARAQHAYAKKSFGQCAELLAKIFAPEANVAYDHACCLALAGRKNEAFERLGYAIDHGFHDIGHAERDPDLASLRSDRRWPWR